MMNIEIIPNWHPIFVHFTVALLSISALLYLAGLVLKKENFLIAARWNLWIGATTTIVTVIAGFNAYNSIPHDGPLHEAMTDHKNWALTTASIFGLLSLWSLLKHRGAKTVSKIFVAIIVLASGLLAVTGYKGAEVVYRHGGGVMRMPEVHGDGGHGSHSHGEDAGAGHHGPDTAKSEETGDHHGSESGHDHGSHPHGAESGEHGEMPKVDDGHDDGHAGHSH